MPKFAHFRLPPYQGCVNSGKYPKKNAQVRAKKKFANENGTIKVIMYVNSRLAHMNDGKK